MGYEGMHHGYGMRPGAQGMGPHNRPPMYPNKGYGPTSGPDMIMHRKCHGTVKWVDAMGGYMVTRIPEMGDNIEVFVPLAHAPKDSLAVGLKLQCSVVEVNGRLQATDVVVEKEVSIEQSLEKFRNTLGPGESPTLAAASPVTAPAPISTSTQAAGADPSDSIPDWSSILESFYGGSNPASPLTPDGPGFLKSPLGQTSALASIFDEMMLIGRGAADVEKKTLSRSSSDTDFFLGKNKDAEYQTQQDAPVLKI